MSYKNINLKLQQQEFFFNLCNNILQGIVNLVTLDTNNDAGSELQCSALIVIIYYIKQ
jgi:hypothetical protein